MKNWAKACTNDFAWTSQCSASCTCTLKTHSKLNKCRVKETYPKFILTLHTFLPVTNYMCLMNLYTNLAVIINIKRSVTFIIVGDISSKLQSLLYLVIGADSYIAIDSGSHTLCHVPHVLNYLICTQKVFNSIYFSHLKRSLFPHFLLNFVA